MWHGEGEHRRASKYVSVKITTRGGKNNGGNAKSDLCFFVKPLPVENFAKLVEKYADFGG